MDRHIKLSAVFLFLISLFFSCKKSNDIPASFPHELKLINIVPKGVTKVYINKTEVKNPAVIAKFISSNPGFFELQSSSFISYNTKYITFTEKDAATFGNINFKYAVSLSGNQFIFKPKSGYVATSINPIVNYLKYKTIVPTPGFTGNNVPTIVYYSIPAYGTYNNLQFPVMSIMYSNNIGYTYNRGSSSYEFNEFNIDAIQNQTSNDTVAVREFTFTYKYK